jgi:hypothetical protein
MWDEGENPCRTPISITGKVRQFASELGSTDEPLFVPVIPEPWANEGNCFMNARLAAEEQGGEVKFGWRIWEFPRFFLEAEFHAILLGSDGELRDVTPEPSEERTLFVPDPERVWEGRPVMNRRLLISTDKRAVELAGLLDQIQEINHNRWVASDDAGSTYRDWTREEEELIRSTAPRGTELMDYFKRQAKRSSRGRRSGRSRTR